MQCHGMGYAWVTEDDTICAILVKGIMRNICVIFFFEFGPVDQEEMPFKYMSYLLHSSGGHLVCMLF